MSNSHREVTASLCGGIPLCVYDSFDVHPKYLCKGHQIVMTHQKPGCDNTLIIPENSLGELESNKHKDSIGTGKIQKANL